MRGVKDIEEIIRLHKDGYSYNEIAKLKDVTKSIVAYYCNLKRNNNIIERFKRKDELRCEYEKIVCDAISECNNIYQVCLKLNKRPTNTNIRYVEDIISKYNVSTEHFSLCSVQSGKHMKKISDEEVFTKRNKFFNIAHLKKRLFERGGIDLTDVRFVG